VIVKALQDALIRPTSLSNVGPKRWLYVDRVRLDSDRRAPLLNKGEYGAGLGNGCMQSREERVKQDRPCRRFWDAQIVVGKKHSSLAKVLDPGQHTAPCLGMDWADWLEVEAPSRDLVHAAQPPSHM
jgi:hypothetical protein